MVDAVLMTEQQIAEELRKLVGPIGEPETLPIELLAVRRMALAIDDFDPIHFDENAARARGYRGIVAPWPILSLLYSTFLLSYGQPELPFGRVTVHGQDEFDYYEPIIVGDAITVHTDIVSTEVKHGRSGLLGLYTKERRFVNQFDQLCAVLHNVSVRRM